MAEFQRRLSQNVQGEFFVDDTCIDCDTCREIAPETFQDHGGQSSVYHQPIGSPEKMKAFKALVCCPTASIGTMPNPPGIKAMTVAAVAAYPERVDSNVYFCGFTSEKSFGGWSYLILRRPEDGGNVLVDSPRFTRPLARRIRKLGGIRTMFLTHRDDIADHAIFAREFGCSRIMHAADGASRLGIERVMDGAAPLALDADLLAIPTPGHTRGHTVLLYRDKFPFTGDHLAWSPAAGTLKAFRDVCWYSWRDQIESMERLLEYRFEWILPGHGRMHHDSQSAMRRHLLKCIQAMKA